MAETWLCRLEGAKGFSKPVVLKILKSTQRDAENRTMFADEARLGMQLEHPNIAQILEFGEVNDVPFIVQEHVDGPSVFQILRRERQLRDFDMRIGVRIVGDVAAALDYAHN